MMLALDVAGAMLDEPFIPAHPQGVEPQTPQARNGITSGESTTISTVQTPQATVMGKLSPRQGSIGV